MKRITRIDRVRNEEVPNRIKENITLSVTFLKSRSKTGQDKALDELLGVDRRLKRKSCCKE